MTFLSQDQLVVQAYESANEAVVFLSTLTFFLDPYDISSGVHPKTGAGSGTIVDARNGIVLTNYHVIQNIHDLHIVLADGSSHQGELLGFDKEYDVAVLRMFDAPHDLRQVELGDSQELRVGEQVLAIGNPHGLDRTLTVGVVSSLGRTVRNAGNFLMKDLIQTDAAINPGSSGGPLINLAGKMIGMNTAILSTTGESSGIGFAVPSNELRAILPELIRDGKILRPKMGWLLVDSNHGPLVQRVFPDTPADEAGIIPLDRPAEDEFSGGFIRDFANADIVHSINGEKVGNRQDVDRLISAAPRDTEVHVTLKKRGSGDLRTLRIVPQLG